MQRASKRAPQWLRDLGVFILVMGGAVGVCMLLSACYDDNNPFATSVFILAVVLISRFTNGYLPGVLAAAVGVVGALVAIGGGITVGELSVLLNYANQYTKPFNDISGVMTELQNALALSLIHI